MTHPPPGKYLSIAANQRVKREDEKAASPDPLPSDEGKRWTIYLYPSGERSMALSSVPNTRAVEVMPVSDMPRREAEVRAATLREVEALREALDMAIYHADNLRRFISNVPVRDLAESEAGFQRAKAIAARFNPETEL